jgi:peptide/nickel transport system ATP-binding protein
LRSRARLGRIVSGLMAVSSGEVRLDGVALRQGINKRSRDNLREIQFAFQMADVALKPRHTIRKTLARPLQFYFNLSGEALETQVKHLMHLVESPDDMLSRFPSELSGGQKQRVNRARPGRET